MEVKLIQAPSFPETAWETMYIAARTCYSAKSPIDLYEQTKNYEQLKEFVVKVLKSGHLSIAEHVNFTFAISGISRACSHQLVRHRLCTFSQQSQRYVEIKESQDELDEAFTDNYTSENFADTKLAIILNKYFVDGDKFKNANGYYYALDNYLESIKHGEKAEDARRFLPNATKTNLVMTCNLRQLLHISELRLCTRAQNEIRQLFKKMQDELCKYNLDLGLMLMPQCEKLGYCPESKCCGRKQSLEDLLISEYNMGVNVGSTQC